MLCLISVEKEVLNIYARLLLTAHRDQGALGDSNCANMPTAAIFEIRFLTFCYSSMILFSENFTMAVSYYTTARVFIKREKSLHK